jgi:hypothetical protein
MRSAAVLLIVLVGSSLYAPANSAARANSYASGFRAAYLPVVSTLHRVTPACATVTRVEQLPACGTASARSQTALARFLQFVTRTPSPPGCQG